MVPAFHRDHDAEGYIARRVIIRLLFDPFTVKWACARRLRGCSCAGSQSRSFSTLFTNKNPITPELRYLTAKMAAQDGPARVLLGSYGSASSVIVRHRRSTILRYDSRAENAGATSPRRATPCYGLPSHPAACRFPTSCNKASWRLSSRRAKPSNS